MILLNYVDRIILNILACLDKEGSEKSIKLNTRIKIML
jgi:hypothetical protein